MSSIVLQFLNGLAGACALFLVACGLSLIFGVSRIVNFAHGSLYMLGLYIAYSVMAWLAGGSGMSSAAFWGGIAIAALAVALLGAVIEMLVLRRIYGSPELFQLLATFGVMLVVRDAALWLWGPEDLLGPRAPGLSGSVLVLGEPFPAYDLLLIAIGPVVLFALWWTLHHTRWGTLVRAATEDRDMAGALGVNEKRLFTGVFALGAMLAGMGGALQIPREPAALSLDLGAIADAFVVVVVGGMGSIPGAFLAALLIGEIKSFCIGLGEVSLLGMTVSLPKLTLVAESIVMAAVLIARPWGLLGRPIAQSVLPTRAVDALQPAGNVLRWLAVAVFVGLLALPLAGSDYSLVLTIDMLVFALFAGSLHFLMGPAGMASFGHAAYFGLGCYGAALLLKRAGMPMESAMLLGPALSLAAAAVYGWFCVRLSGVYLAMLTLAFAQITWSAAYQWDHLTGGSNGMIGIWPADWIASRPAFYLMTVVICVLGLLALRRLVFSPYGAALRACRDAPLRAEALGIDVVRFQWSAFIVAGTFAGVAGAVYAFSKGSISPESLSIGRSVDALVMVLLGGVQSLAGSAIGAALFIWLQDTVARYTDYWRGLLGLVIVAMVLLFPHGIAGFVRQRFKVTL